MTADAGRENVVELDLQALLLFVWRARLWLLAGIVSGLAIAAIVWSQTPVSRTTTIEVYRLALPLGGDQAKAIGSYLKTHLRAHGISSRQTGATTFVVKLDDQVSMERVSEVLRSFDDQIIALVDQKLQDLRQMFAEAPGNEAVFEQIQLLRDFQRAREVGLVELSRASSPDNEGPTLPKLLTVYGLMGGFLAFAAYACFSLIHWIRSVEKGGALRE